MKIIIIFAALIALSAAFAPAWQSCQDSTSPFEVTNVTLTVGDNLGNFTICGKTQTNITLGEIQVHVTQDNSTVGGGSYGLGSLKVVSGGEVCLKNSEYIDMSDPDTYHFEFRILDANPNMQEQKMFNCVALDYQPIYHIIQ